MKASRRSKADVRGGKINASSSKRKLADVDGVRKTGGQGQHKSIADLLSSQESSQSLREVDAAANKRLKRGHNLSQEGYPSVAGTFSTARMYSFAPSKSKANGVIDLTRSSPPSSPQGRSQARVFHSPVRTTFAPHQGPKKLVVKNLRSTPRVDPEQYFTRIWAQLDVSLTAIFKSDKPSFSLEELYKGAENVCKQGKAPELYKRLRQRCVSQMAENVKGDLGAKAMQSSDTEVLKAFVDAWSLWNQQLVTIRSIFFYMDQTYLLRSNDHPSIKEMGNSLARKHIFKDKVLKPKIMQGAMDLLYLDRKGDANEDNTLLVKKSVEIFHELEIYTDDFEPSLRSSSETYYQSWSATEAERSSLSSYADEATKLLSREMTWCDLFNFDRSTRIHLSELFDYIIVEGKVDLLTEEDAVLELLKHDNYQALEQVYTLLERKGLEAELSTAFNSFVVDEGSAIVFDEKHEAEMVVNLLDFKRRLDHVSMYCFHSNETLANGLHKSFELFMNKTKKTQANWDTDNVKPGEMIAKHVDLLLKGGVKAIPKLLSATKMDSSKTEEDNDFDEAPTDEDAEINLHLSHALDLFRFVHGKAVFEAFYKKDLARRLLMGRSASNDAERSMLARLTTECGSGFTHNLESMFKDMDLARDEMASYNQLLTDRGTKNTATDLSVNVLSASAWPTYPDVPVNIPTTISKLTSDFETHYKTKHNGRKLTWKHALSHCQLKANFPRGKKEIVVSGFQAIVLLLFNDVPSDSAGTLSYTDIQSATGLSDAELKRTLQSLACAKYRVLTKTPKGREVNPTDTFGFNSAFTDTKMRIKINQIQLKETKEENKETHQRVAADRHYETQAAIVRIMKSRKTIRHVELVSEVIKATKSRGVLDAADIKKNIEKYVPFYTTLFYRGGSFDRFGYMWGY